LCQTLFFVLFHDKKVYNIGCHPKRGSDGSIIAGVSGGASLPDDSNSVAPYLHGD